MTPGNTRPRWLESAGLPSFPPLAQDLTVDTVIVGGGITGITTAYLLTRAGQKVALLEQRRCLRGDTGHTTAHLTAVTDQPFTAVARHFDPAVAGSVWSAGVAAIAQIETVIRSEGIDCEFRRVPGYLHQPAPASGMDSERWFAEEAAFAKQIGLPAEFRKAVPFFGVPGVLFPQQALFHPVKYLAALLSRIQAAGGHIYENSAAGEFSPAGRSIAVGSRRIHYRHLVDATHSARLGSDGAFSSLLFQTKIALYTSYVIGFRLQPGQLPEASFWDTAQPYHYLRVDHRETGDYGIYGGEDHKTGQNSDTSGSFRRLRESLQRILPDVAVDRLWSGQVVETIDGLPYIGWMAPDRFVATGFAGNGMTFGTLGAMMAAEAIVGGESPWKKLFDPHRTKLRGATLSYLRENSDYPFLLVRDRLSGGERSTLDALRSGEGCIAKINGRKVAAYRDVTGKMTLLSPVCTHLKCIVGWNNAEHTWDCPCHGARFAPTGEVIAGPAPKPLDHL